MRSDGFCRAHMQPDDDRQHHLSHSGRPSSCCGLSESVIFVPMADSHAHDARYRILEWLLHEVRGMCGVDKTSRSVLQQLRQGGTEVCQWGRDRTVGLQFTQDRPVGKETRSALCAGLPTMSARCWILRWLLRAQRKGATTTVIAIVSDVMSAVDCCCLGLTPSLLPSSR